MEREEALTTDNRYPSLIINSIDLTLMLGLIGNGEFASVTRMLIEAVQQLGRGGADFALLASNTPHLGK